MSNSSRLLRIDDARTAAAATAPLAEIAARFGSVPPCFAAAARSPRALAALWHHTRDAWLDAPLPARWMETLGLLAARESGVSYSLMVNACTLHSSGTSGAQLLALLRAPAPDRRMIEAAVGALAIAGPFDRMPDAGSGPGDALLACAVAALLRTPDAARARGALRAALQAEQHDAVVAYLGYIVASQEWLHALPELSALDDPRVGARYDALVREVPEIAPLLDAPRAAAGGQGGGRSAREDELIAEVAQRRRAEDLLRESEALHRSVVGAMREGVILYGGDGRPRAWNASAERILAVTPEEIEQRGAGDARWDAVREDGTAWPAHVLPAAETLRTGESCTNVVYGVRRRDGTVAWLLVNTRVIARDSVAGGELACVLTFADITWRKEADARRRESEHRLRAAMDAGLDAFFIMRALYDDRGSVFDFEFVDANARGAALMALDQPGIIGRRLSRLYPDAHTHGLFAQCEQVMRTGRVVEAEYERMHPAMRAEWMRVQVALVNDGVAVTARDVTAQTRAAAALRASEARFRGILERMRTPALCLDVAGNVTFANDALVELVGWPREELLGSGWFERCIPDGAQVRRVFEDSMAAGSEVPAQFENEVVTRSGARRTVSWGNAMLRDGDGRVIGTASVGQDATERVRVARMKSELIAVASHELRTPLTAIRGALDLLVNFGAARDDRETKLLEMAARNSSRLARLVNDLLDVERIESGKIALHPVALNSLHLMGSVADGMQTVADRTGVTLTVAREPLTLWADVDRATQVLTNLVDNAIKFSPAGSTVMLSAVPDGAMIRFSIRDAGRGIPADMLATIFEPFEQVDADDGRGKGGAGLGLAICRAIVRQHGGRIWAESAGLGEGTGSTFQFTLPATEPSVAAGAGAMVVAAAGNQ